MSKASGKQDIVVRFVGVVKGDPGFVQYVLVELDEKEDLGGIKFDTVVFCKSPATINARLAT